MAATKAIKFYATWCGPCRVYSKTWDDVKGEFSTVEFIEVDIEKDTTGLAAKYRIASIPTTVIINQDGTETKKTGRLTEEELTNLIK